MTDYVKELKMLRIIIENISHDADRGNGRLSAYVSSVKDSMKKEDQSDDKR